MKTKTFKLIATLFVAAISLGFTSCGDDDENDPQKPGKEEVDPGQTDDLGDCFPYGIEFKAYTLNSPGTLPNMISSSEKETITALKIKGSINGTDLLFIRKMAGVYVEGEEVEDASLVYLDLSEARIVEGGKAYDYYSYDGEEGYLYTKEDILGEEAFSDSHLKAVALPKGLKSIGDRAFEYCSDLNSIYLGNSLKSIGADVFYNCTKLKSITFPNTLTRIGSGAFYGCKGLKSINIPSSVTSIEDTAFGFCKSLKDVIVHWPRPISSNAEDVFWNNAAMTLHVPAGTLSKYENDDGWGIFDKFIEDADDYPVE